MFFSFETSAPGSAEIMLPKSKLQELVYVASRRGPLKHTFSGTLPGFSRDIETFGRIAGACPSR